MIQKIRVKTIEGSDTIGESVLYDIVERLGIKIIHGVETVKVYRLEGITQKQAEVLAKKLFCEEINQTYSINEPLIRGASSIIEISYKPGVMNPEIESILKAAKLLKINPKAVDSSREYAFYGEMARAGIDNIVLKLNLFNPVIEHIVKEEPKTLLLKGIVGQTNTISIRKMSETNSNFMPSSPNSDFSF